MARMGRNIACEIAADIQAAFTIIGVSAETCPVVGVANSDLARVYPVHDDTPRKITITITSFADAARIATALKLVTEGK